jgi:hypothetical protein
MFGSFARQGNDGIKINQLKWIKLYSVHAMLITFIYGGIAVDEPWGIRRIFPNFIISYVIIAGVGMQRIFEYSRKSK